jgi:pentatricopeptide repeat protein
MHSTAKSPVVTLTIQRKDGSEDHFVRREPVVAAPISTSRAATSDEHDEIYQVVMECAPYTASFNALLARPALKDDAQQMVALVHHRMHSEGIPLNSETYNLLMKRVVRFADGSIFTLYEEFKKEGRKENSSVRPNLETFVLLFRACERSAQYSKAFVLYQQMREYFRLVPDTTTYNTLLGYCAAVRDVAQATFLIEEMKQLDVPRDVNTYNCLMSVMVTSAPYAEVMKVFQELLTVNIKPSNRSYNTILKAACRHGDYDRAFQLTEEMKKRGLVPDVETYNYLMSLCEQRLDYVKGTGSYATEHRRHDQVVEGTLAIAELVLTLLREMRSMRANPNTYTYNKALSTLVVCEDERVFAVFNDMVREANKERAVQGTSGSDGAVVQINLKKKAAAEDDVDAGVLLETALQAEERNDVGNIRGASARPNLATWKEVTKACLHFNHFKQAKDVYDNMRENHLTLSAELGHLLLQVCCKAKDRIWAEQLLEELKAASVLLSTDLMNDYLRVLCAVDDSKTVLQEYEAMRLGIHPSGAWANTDTGNIVLAYTCSKPTKRKVAEELYTNMSQPYSTVPANEETYRIRLESYAGREDLDTDAALQYVEDVVNRHPPQSVSFYHAVLRCLLRRDDPRICAWFDRLHSNAAPVKDGIVVAADVTCYNLVMEYYLRHQNYTRIRDIYAELQCSPTLEPDNGTYRVLFEVARRQGDPRTTTKLFEHVRVNSVNVDTLCYNSILQTYMAHDESLVCDVLSYMKEHHVAPSSSTMAVFLTDPKGRQILASAMTRNLFYTPVPPAPLERLRP